jgi:hypothetical protein
VERYLKINYISSIPVSSVSFILFLKVILVRDHISNRDFDESVRDGGNINS